MEHDSLFHHSIILFLYVFFFGILFWRLIKTKRKIDVYARCSDKLPIAPEMKHRKMIING